MIEGLVEELIDHQNGRWRREKIVECFNHNDATNILAIPISSALHEDRRIWKLTRHGFFTVKSAYHLAVSKFSQIHNGRPSSSITPKEWKKMWNIKTIPRIRMFVWRMCSNSLPTKDNLRRRGSEVDLVCLLCGEETETLDHLLLQCRTAKLVWYSSTLRIEISRMQVHTIRDLFWLCLNKYPDNFVALMAYMAWEIWRTRNRVCFEQYSFNVEGIIERGYTQWIELMKSREEEIQTAVQETHTVEWKKLRRGKNKINCDVAVQGPDKVGYGFVLRNEQGRVIFARKSEEIANGSSTLLEARAMKYALQMVKQYGMQAEGVESDSLSLINGLNGRSKPKIYCDILIADIKMIAAEMECTSFDYIPRNDNRVAHQAAQGPEFISIKHTPAHLVPFVIDDLNI